MSGRASKVKGAAAELEVCEILSKRLGVKIKRNLGQARDGGDDITIAKYRIEVKRRETLSIDAWCAQVEAAAVDDEIPLLIYRRNKQPWRVVMRLDDFLPLLADDLDLDLSELK